MATTKNSIKVDTRELNKLADKIAGKAVATQRNIDTAVKQAAFLIDAKAKEKIQKGSRSGSIRRRRSVVHQASAQGEPPKTDTGRLVASIRPVFYGKMSAEVGSLNNIAKYGGMLEEGTKNIAARPWLSSTLKEQSDTITKIFDNAIRGGKLAS